MGSIIIISLLSILPFGIEPPEWLTDFDEALEAAYESETERFVFLYFNGSDWCVPCKQLKTKVFSKESFWEYADRKLVLVELDFPHIKANRLPKWQTKYNESIADEYNPDRIFPYIVLINENEEIMDRVYYRNEDAEGFIKKVEEALK